MKIGKKFSEMTLQEYCYYIENHKEYTDFNTLGLFKSIIENENLNIEQMIELREYGKHFFNKFYNFLQLKDPSVYYKLITLGQRVTQGDEEQIWKDIRENQRKFLLKKRFKHRNFGTYSKHNCGIEHCPYNGIMVKQGSFLSEIGMNFKSDKNKYSAKQKSIKFRKERKCKKDIISSREWE